MYGKETETKERILTTALTFGSLIAIMANMISQAENEVSINENKVRQICNIRYSSKNG